MIKSKNIRQEKKNKSKYIPDAQKVNVLSIMR